MSQTVDIQTSMPGKGKHALRNISNVVAGILMEKRTFLVEKRRGDDEADPGYVEIPGGHVNQMKP